MAVEPEPPREPVRSTAGRTLVAFPDVMHTKERGSRRPGFIKRGHFEKVNDVVKGVVETCWR